MAIVTVKGKNLEYAFIFGQRIVKCCGLAVFSALLYACGGGGGSSPGGTPMPTPIPSSSPSPTVTPTPTPFISGNNLDLLWMEPNSGLIRLSGSAGLGAFGVPVAGGHDVNGDGFADFAMASMLADPQARFDAGQVDLVLGSGAITQSIDSGVFPQGGNIVRIIGDGVREMAGSEIWMDDVNGDGLGDLLVARQNYSSSDRIGNGALSIIFGSTILSTLAAEGGVIDLRDPPDSIRILTLVGESALDRLGIWVRAGDIDGDGIADIAVGADQSDLQGTNSGVVYVVRGGEHLHVTQTQDLADLSTSPLDAHIAVVRPPPGAINFHFGATLNIGDLDNNGRAELLVGATINRAGASLRADGAPSGSAQGRGGAPRGRLYIVWDDNFPADWRGLDLVANGDLTGSLTELGGTDQANFSNRSFGEEILGGEDYDGDGEADLFVGDITGLASGRVDAGLGFVFFSAEGLKNLQTDIAGLPITQRMSVIYGPEAGTISSDTALHGDFDGDGIVDLVVASPHATALGRDSSGALHVLWGQSSWPEIIDLADQNQPSQEVFSLSNIWGAHGSAPGDTGDTLGYSAAAGDIDNDGRVDLIVNEMVGNGVAASSVDVGNLLVISGAVVSQAKP